MEQKATVGVPNWRQALRMVIVPALLAIPAVILWHWCYTHGLSSTREADEPIVNAILPGMLTAHVLIVGFVFAHQMTRYTGILGAHANLEDPKSRKLFVVLVQMTVPLPAKFLIFTAAMMIELWVISLHFELYNTGWAAVFSIGYFLSAMWEFIADLDDPFHGMWRIGIEAPEDLMKEVHINRRWSDRLFERLFRNGD
jgi:hypothetical protein